MNLVVFNIKDKEYGVEIKQVKQVIRLRPITFVPEAAAFIEGVISLHANVVPVINLCKKFGQEAGQVSSNQKRIIISEIKNHLIGILVDNVSDVMAIDDGLISPADQMLKDAHYLTAVAKIKNRLILVMDLERVLDSEEEKNIGKLKERVEVRKK